MDETPSSCETQMFISRQPDIERYTVGYIEHTDASILSLCPMRFYQFHVSSESHSNYCIVPGGHMDILFHITQDRFRVVVRGMQLTSMDCTLAAGRYFGVRFLPFPWTPHVLVPMKQLVNSSISLQQFLPITHKDMENVVTSTSFSCQINSFKSMLSHLKPIMNCSASRLIKNGLDYIYFKKGIVTVQELADQLLCSTRYVRKCFEEYIGISPKRFCRIVRYQLALQQLIDNTIDSSLIDISTERGYYDQAHFIHEFKQFSNRSPEQWRECP